MRDTAAMGALRPVTDGLVVIRPPRVADRRALAAGHDDESRRWLGGEVAEPAACVEVDGRVVGWVDYDHDRDWLGPGEVNVGYHVFAAAQGHGFGTRSVQLLMHHLATTTDHRTATLLIDPANTRSLALATRTGFVAGADRDGQRTFARPVPPVVYRDETVAIRRPGVDDLDADLEAKDDEQIEWLWLPGEREAWTAMTVIEQRDHARRNVQANHDAFGRGPKWTFAVDVGSAGYVALVDCDLANGHVPRGEANISYAAHPAHRGQGYVSAAVRLLLRFLHENTGAREAHILVDVENHSSARVARAVGARPVERWITGRGRTMVRHIAEI